MRRKRGVGGQVMSIIGGLILIGIFLAATSMFGGDVIAMFMWVFQKMVDFVMGVKDAFIGMPLFRGLFA